jgi:N-acetylmuramoyl-L-alanine amidase
MLQKRVILMYHRKNSDRFYREIHFITPSAKLEIKFADYTIKFTAKNQFVVLKRRSNDSQNIFQLPVSTLFIGEDIFIPLSYSFDYLSMGYGKKIIFDNKNKSLQITEESFSPSSLFVEKTNKPETTQSETAQKPIVKKNIDSKYDIYELAIEEKANGTLIRLKASRKINIPRHSIGNNTLYVFFTNTSIAPDIIKNVKSAGLVKDASRSVVSSKNIQLEFKLRDGYSTSEIFKDNNSNDLIITIHNKFLVQQTPKPEEIKSKWIFDAVVLDAGHGGKDPGAIGVTGVKEKNVNLGIALKLGKLIEKNMPSVKVVYTRKTDEFVELYKRGKIANEVGGKLFISIHCNSTPQKDVSTRGFEVYLLRPGRTKQAIAIAEFENSVINFEDDTKRYQQLTDENFILVSMAHSQYMRYSEKFSDLLNQQWKKNVGIPSLGIKQAGFYVLVGASMPSVLIEAGFLSNRKDEAHLASTSGQSEIAQAYLNR